MLKSFLTKIRWVVGVQLGLDHRRFFTSLRGVPRFVSDWRRFRQDYAGRMDFKPCLFDRFEEGGSTKDEYFWQDLLVARMVFAEHPQKHVDIGSRVDGFVAHLASFRDIEVFDVRPITTVIPGVTFRQADLMKPLTTAAAGEGYCDSLSCLHAIEHFGLGRYGDPIDAQGYERGLANMAALLQAGGRFYLSTPIGVERVDFNANRVFDPRTILACAQRQGLVLKQLTVISSGGDVENNTVTDQWLLTLSQAAYNLGVFVFEKQAGVKG